MSPGSLVCWAERMLCHVRAWPELLALTAPCCQGSWGRWDWKKEIHKGKEQFGAPGAPHFPITVKHMWPDVQLPRPDLSVGAGHNPTMALRFSLPKRSQASLEQQTKTRGRAATMASTDRPPELAQGMVPAAGAVPPPDPKERLAKPQTSAQCVR